MSDGSDSSSTTAPASPRARHSGAQPSASSSLRARTNADPLTGPRAELARIIPRRPAVAGWLAIVLALGFAGVVMPTITAERWLGALGVGALEVDRPAPLTVRLPPLAAISSRAASASAPAASSSRAARSRGPPTSPASPRPPTRCRTARRRTSRTR